MKNLMKLGVLTLAIVGTATLTAMADGNAFTPLNFSNSTAASNTAKTSPAAVTNTAGNTQFQNAILQLDNAQVSVRNELLNYKSKYSDVDSQYQTVKAQRKALASQIKSCERKIKKIDKQKESIRKNII